MNYHRFRGYDYSRGANLFLTLSLLPRLPLMAVVEGKTARLTAIGEAVAERFRRERERTPAVALKAGVIMPDHVHFYVHLLAGLAAPLVVLGRFMNNFKRWAKYAARQLPGGEAFGWEEGFHDKISLSREIENRIVRYIDYNPLKWTLMHGASPPLAVAEPLRHSRLPFDEWWSGVGNFSLLDGKIAALRLSTKIRPEEYRGVVSRCLGAVARGFVPAGTFISPCERRLEAALIESGASYIKMRPDPLACVHRPVEEEPRLFAEGRLLLLSRAAPADDSRYNAWHGINASLADLARVNGTSLYVCRGPSGRLAYQFQG